MKPNLTSNLLINKIMKTNTKVSIQKRIISNTYFFNFIYFTFLLLILLFLIKKPNNFAV